ncbi:YraN family protein [Cognatiluteimonas telluris]|jgi:putative endonuclease|uniref:YraN family protein n=1 Tax=Cognatiluteimonas telluris TaxID=1104775 RepID=UPI00140E813A|nr:YraN family protein [Lysobacter telluris]
MSVASAIDRRARGAHVEAAARDYLLAAGLRPLASNATYRHGELDLVMRDGDGVVFVEVRYRSGTDFGGGAMSIDARKRRKLVLAAQLFLASHRRLADAPCRFDVIVADGDPAAPNITWLRDAFRADD